MPFKSKAQTRYLFANNPKVAKEFASETSKAQMKRLPEHVKSSSPSQHKVQHLGPHKIFNR